ncbi:toxin-antitoxin system HicB family antitoxin [Pseudanabaena sp. SR411]|uniref:type II toxin-antitoxin system HicB family antitoxin n=1 Tax=Pseudanabaena sp. SR411 TaxID=1980935 RepID=UPI000B993A08|nr:type II toxin-antitoxin system HicB family antitoxin [Pseudanabaena sp. SR411]OYQ65231.1 toxin-antitoxin system HicB family antitoxin [Pseudanabaena sp. SR411]
MTVTKTNKSTSQRQSLDYYLKLTYPITFYPDPDGGYVAEIKDLNGCLSQGETIEEAVTNIKEARELWIETAYEYGDEIPLPSSESEYSGKLMLRMPKGLHQRLATRAKSEGVSLNQYLLFLLSSATGKSAH